MPSETIRVDNDAHVNEQRPNDEAGDSSRLTLRGGGPNRHWVFLWFDLPNAISRHPYIREALLRLTPKHQWSGTIIVTVRRVTQSWREGRINWNNQPTLAAVLVTTTLVDQPADEEFQVDVTSLVQTISNTVGFSNYGFMVSINATTANYRLYSSESGHHKPKLDLSWAQVPFPPNDLYPSGSRSVVLSQPLLTWHYRHSGFGSDEPTQAEAQVEIRNPTTDALLYDSGRRVFSESEFDLASPPAGAPAFGALTNGTEVKWRVKVWDTDGLVSDYSEYVLFRYDSSGVLAITSPTGTPATTADKTLPITWTFTGRVQERLELNLWEWVPATSKWDQIHHFEDQAYALGSYTIPEGLITKKDHDYKVRIRVWDTLDREEQHGYTEAIKVFQYVRSGVPGAPLTFTLATSDPTPKLLADWSNPTAGRPDHFALWRDGEVFVPRLDPDVYETAAGATTYQASLYYSEPYVSHTYDLVAVVNDAGVLKESNPFSRTVTIRPIGIWLVCPETMVEVCILARETPDMSVTEVGETFQPLGRRGGVRVVESIGGWTGTVSGELGDFNGVTVETWRDRLETLKSYVNQEEIRLIIGRYNFPIVFEEGSSFSPLPDGSYSVSLPFYQSNEFFVTRV